MPITVKKNNDGLWLCFDSNSGKHAMVNVQKLIPRGGSIIEKAVVETCEECASENQGS